MNSTQKHGLIFGFVLLLMWFAILIKSQTEFFATVFGSRRTIFCTILSAFNFLACVAWMYGVYKLKFENKRIFVLLSSIWLGSNLGVIIFSITSLVFFPVAHDLLHDYPYIVPIIMFATVIHFIVLWSSYMIYISMMEDDYQQSMPESGMYTNKSTHQNIEDTVGDDIEYRSRMLDDECDPWENKFVAVSVPHDSVPHDLVPHSHSHDHHISSPHSRHGSHRHGNSLHFHHKHGDRLRKGSTASSNSVRNDYYEPSDDCTPISTATSHRGQEMHHFGNNVHSHGHCTNDELSSHPHYSHSHDTHYTPSHSTPHHDTHTSSHDTTSHDTHTSSHDTHDYGGCDSGGGNDTGGDCGGGDD